MPKIKRSDTTKFICYRYPAGLGKIIDSIMVRRLAAIRKKLISRQSASTYVRDKNVNANCVMPAINVHVN